MYVSMCVPVFRCEKKQQLGLVAILHTNRIYMIGHCQSAHAWRKLEREKKIKKANQNKTKMNRRRQQNKKNEEKKK